jgi:hypothetical protein
MDQDLSQMVVRLDTIWMILIHGLVDVNGLSSHHFGTLQIVGPRKHVRELRKDATDFGV